MLPMLKEYAKKGIVLGMSALLLSKVTTAAFASSKEKLEKVVGRKSYILQSSDPNLWRFFSCIASIDKSTAEFSEFVNTLDEIEEIRKKKDRVKTEDIDERRHVRVVKISTLKKKAVGLYRSLIRCCPLASEDIGNFSDASKFLHLFLNSAEEHVRYK